MEKQERRQIRRSIHHVDVAKGQWGFAPQLRGLGALDDAIGCVTCFGAGTEVATPDGLRGIEDIKVGDRVLAYDETTGKTEPRRVTALIRPLPKAVLDVTLTDAGGEAERFVATADHPWLVVRGEGRTEWVETLDLKPGVRIATADGRGAIFANAALREGLAQTYNLEVEGLHTFLVGDDGVVVHNCKWFNPKFVPPALRQAINNTVARFNAGAAGRPFRNWSGRLPASGAPYSKLPVNTAANNARVVQGTDGSRYITFDHYETFQRMR